MTHTGLIKSSTPRSSAGSRNLSEARNSSSLQDAARAEAAAAEAILFTRPLPHGFNSSALVPFDRGSARVAASAHVLRLTNSECAKWEQLQDEGAAYLNTQPPPGLAGSKCTIGVDELLVF